MKFGHLIQREMASSPAEWAPFWLNYKLLKVMHVEAPPGPIISLVYIPVLSDDVPCCDGGKVSWNMQLQLIKGRVQLQFALSA